VGENIHPGVFKIHNLKKTRRDFEIVNFYDKKEMLGVIFLTKSNFIKPLTTYRHPEDTSSFLRVPKRSLDNTALKEILVHAILKA
jgi:hypothetical protein